MHIREIILENFATIKTAHLRLPETGLVLVTGDNGQGKTALTAESLATAFYGKTLRGTPPWSPDQDRTSVQVITDSFKVTRVKEGNNTPVLEWEHNGETHRKDTPTKSSIEFSTLVPSFDVWKRTRVFSGKGADHFSMASDGERKRLLEEIRGLDCFDPALKACRVDLATCNRSLTPIETEIARLTERIAGLKDRLRDLDEEDASEAQVLSRLLPEERVRQNQARIAKLQSELQKASAKKTEAYRSCSHADAEYAQARRARQNLDRDSCPTCGQDIPDAQRKALRAGVSAAERAAKEAQQRMAELEQGLRFSEETTQDELQACQDYVRRAQQIAKEHAAVALNKQRRVDRRAALQAELAVQEKKLAKAEAERKILLDDREELLICERILGLRGPRTYMLEDTLKALTIVANAWLARMYNGVTMGLIPEKDKVVLKADGMPHPYGYKACSSGQRSRFDIANILALSEYEAAMNGLTQGTLVFDEVDASLDKGGLNALTEILQKVSEDRCVIVISQRPEYLQNVAMRVHVSNGRVTVH